MAIQLIAFISNFFWISNDKGIDTKKIQRIGEAIGPYPSPHRVENWNGVIMEAVALEEIGNPKIEPHMIKIRPWNNEPAQREPDFSYR